MGDLQLVPWMLAAGTALWLGLLAYRAKSGCAFWAVGGGLYALVVSTILIGLFQAGYIPLTESAKESMSFKAIGLSLALIVVPGMLATRQLWRGRASQPSQPPAPPPPAGTGKA